MTNKTYQLETLTCPTCINKITTAVKKLSGVEDVEVLFNASKVKVGFNEESKDPDSSSDVKNLIEKLGFKVLGEK